MRRSGARELAEQPVEVAPVDGDVRTRSPTAPPSANARAFSGVVAPFELAVGALEVVLVEAALVDDATVVVDLADMKVCRLVAGVIRPATPDQVQTLAPHRHVRELELGVLLEDALERRPECGDGRGSGRR